jgi:hypothetical protein
MNNFLLQDRADLALNGIINSTDELYHHFPYQNTFLNSSPPEMRHIISGLDAGEIILRFLVGILYAKNMLDIRDRLPIEETYIGYLEKLQDMNDLGLCGQMKTDWSPAYPVSHFNEPHRMMFESLLLLIESGNTEYERRADRFINGIISRERDWMLERADEKQTMTDFNIGEWEENLINPYTVSWLLDPLVRYYRLTSKNTVRGLIDSIVARHPILNDPAFRENGSFDGHVHTKLSGIIGLLRYAMLTGDGEILRLCRQSYEWFLNGKGSSIGWFPEIIKPGRDPKEEDCETCCISNMIDLAILLAKATGDDIYWNDAEMFTRNQLMEQQLTRIDWIPEPVLRNSYPSDSRKSYAHVLSRSAGIFHGDAAVNDYAGNNPPCHFRTMTGCCTSWGTRALYFAWHNGVRESAAEGSGVPEYRVAMPFDRDSAAVSVRGYEPWEGRIRVIMKKPGLLSVRIPDWSRLRYKRRFMDKHFSDVKDRWGANWYDRRYIRCAVNGLEQDADTGKSFIPFGPLRAGDTAEITYPIRWDKHEEEIGGRTFSLEWLGSTCVGISPPGLICPLYRRGYLKREPYPGSRRSFPFPEKEFAI